jgi:hypothetical protein
MKYTTGEDSKTLILVSSKGIKETSKFTEYNKSMHTKDMIKKSEFGKLNFNIT